jgi:opacity protein-like surface antigen
VIGRLALALLLGGSTLLHAQATPTASRTADAQIGVGYTTAKPDYGSHSFQGIAAYADFDLRSHLGIEAEFHRVNSQNGDLAYQQTYEIGGRCFRTYGNFAPYLKAMVGSGTFNYPFGLTKLDYTLYAGGVGADYKLGDHLRIRGEYEYQSWSGFTNGSLNPQLITVGVAYHITGKPRYRQ